MEAEELLTFEELEDLVYQWSIERGIFSGSDETLQAKKTQEETGELLMAVAEDDREKVMDAVGDIMVTLVNITEFYDTNLTECLDLAYNQIKDRKGQMINGIFVKEEE